MVSKARLLDRFLRYVQVGSAADLRSETYPSSPGQLVLGKILVDELRAMGLATAHQDPNGLVRATLKSRTKQDSATVLFNAHLDTSPEASGDNVRPRIIDAYDGNDILLEHDGQRISASDCPALAELVGKTLVVTDGRTLLGSDDKAGVAAIMELVATLQEHPEILHGPIEILFTCDEEIGCGTAKVDLKGWNANVAYTLDGGGIGEIDEETFSADMATITFDGHNIHPSIGKGRMKNALRSACLFVSRLPLSNLSPESTEGREGFLHPYDLQGGVGQSKLHVLLRDFDAIKLEEYRQQLEQLAREVERDYAGVSIRVEVTPQYRNMAEGLKRLPQAVDLAVAAYEKLGIKPRRTIVRGGTDGSQLTAMGLPTPNLSVGQHNIHSVREFACVDQMVTAVEHLVELVQLWGDVSVDSIR